MATEAMRGTNNNRLPDIWRPGQFGWRSGSEVIDGLLTLLRYCLEGHPDCHIALWDTRNPPHNISAIYIVSSVGTSFKRYSRF